MKRRKGNKPFVVELRYRAPRYGDHDITEELLIWLVNNCWGKIHTEEEPCQTHWPYMIFRVHFELDTDAISYKFAWHHIHVPAGSE